jgi:hypothetical protein
VAPPVVKADGGEGSGGCFGGIVHRLRKREDWTLRRKKLSLLVDHIMTKYIIII